MSIAKKNSVLNQVLFEIKILTEITSISGEIFATVLTIDKKSRKLVFSSYYLSEL